ncbi:hypothetical protein ACQUJT_02100 [Ralstonia pseudosolanacearum]
MTISSVALSGALSDADNLDLANARKELSEALDKIALAIKSNKDVQTTASELGEKGFWSSLTGVVSGSNDKDLAGMIKRLGGSLDTTQIVVQVMLRLQTSKDRVLRGFHSALLDKIANIQADTKTLDANQRAVALEIVSALRDQVEDQLRQCEAVDRHELRLEEIGLELARIVEVENEFRESLKALDNQASSLRNSEAHLSREVETLQGEVKALEAELRSEAAKADHRMQRIQTGLDALVSKRVEDLASVGAWQERLRSAIEGDRQAFKSSIDTLSFKLDHLIVQGTALEQRVGRLEAALAAKPTWRDRVQQHSIGLVGLCIALGTLAYTYRG